MTRKHPREIPDVYRRRLRSSTTRRSRRIFGPRTLYNPQHRPSDSPTMRVYNDSVFLPNSSYSSSVTRDAVDAFDTTPRIRSPSPSVQPTRKTSSNYTVSRAWQFNSSDYKARIAKLGTHGRRVMQYYAGNTPEAQIRTLKKLEEHKLSHKQSPIVPIGKEGPRGGESQLKWECRICSVIFPTFQKVAVHLTSGEWCLPNWRCPDLLCARIYQSRNELNRHEKSHFSAGRKKSPAETIRSSLGSLSPPISPVKDGKRSQTDTAVQTLECPVINPPIQPISHRQMNSLSTSNCNWFGCPSQALRRTSCDSEIGGSMHLVGPRPLSVEPVQPQGVIHSQQYQLQPSDVGWRGSNQLNRVLSSSFGNAEPCPFVTSSPNPELSNPEWPNPKPGVCDISFQHQGGSIDNSRPATLYQCPSPQLGDLLQEPFMSTFPQNIPTNPPMALAYQHYYPHDTLPDPFLSQDVTINRKLCCDWPHRDSDLETLGIYLDTRNNLEQSSTLLNRSVSDSYYRLPPTRHHGHHTESMTENHAMVRLRPSPRFRRPIWEGEIMAARVRGSTNLLIGYYPTRGLVCIAKKFASLALSVVLVWESLYELYACLDNRYWFEKHSQQRN